METNMQVADWISTGGDHPKGLPKLAFPLKGAMPKVYVSQSTMLRMSDGSHSHAYLWCYLERKVYGSRYLFKPSSLSSQRVKDLPRAIERLSKRFCFDNARPLSVAEDLKLLSAFMYWIDAPFHQGRYESILSNPDLALIAIQRHHSHLRQRMQANHTGTRLSAAAASKQDVAVIKTMSEIHDRLYGNEIEAIQFVHGDGVTAPKAEDVAAFMACVQGVFDSVISIAFNGREDYRADSYFGELSWQSGGQGCTTAIRRHTHIERVMELGCMAFAALCIGDSGANLAQIQAYEEPADMQEQLDNPEKLNLRHKIVKFRARGKEVPVHLTSTTMSRLRSFLRLREALRLLLDCPDIGPMFVQCEYRVPAAKKRPLRIIPLTCSFTTALRRRFSSFGAELPEVSSQQLRAHKQGKLTKEHNLQVAADMMGTTVSTAIRRYSKITEAESRSEMAPFLASLTSVVLTRSKTDEEGFKPTIPITAIPSGGCADHGHPESLVDNPLVEPDCKKTEGCFFCNKYQVHANEEDTIKLMSCRSVLERMAPRLGDLGAAERVYGAVSDRICALLSEIKRINPKAHERARVTVLEERRLSRFWASKLQQLHLLGLLAPGADRTSSPDAMLTLTLTDTGPPTGTHAKYRPRDSRQHRGEP